MKLKVGCTIPQRMHNNALETMNHILCRVLNTKERFRIATTIKLDSRFETLHSIEWHSEGYLKGFFWGKDGVYIKPN